MNVVGIDPSLTGCGVVVIGENAALRSKDVFATAASGNQVDARMNRYRGLVRSVMAIVNEANPQCVTIEAYSLRSTGPGHAQRIELGGLLRYAIASKYPNLLWEVAPATLKKWATAAAAGKGKIGVAVGLYKMYGVEFATDDEYDAYGLARMAFQIAGGEMPGTVRQSEAIKTVTTPKVAKRKGKEEGSQRVF